MRILIVEDEPLLSAKLQKMLRGLMPAAEMRTCNSICSALDLLARNQPDLIMMDVELADGQCFEIFRRLVITSPVIFTTAYDESVLPQSLAAGSNFLYKPIRVEALKKALANVNWPVESE